MVEKVDKVYSPITDIIKKHMQKQNLFIEETIIDFRPTLFYYDSLPEYAVEFFFGTAPKKKIKKLHQLQQLLYDQIVPDIKLPECIEPFDYNEKSLFYGKLVYTDTVNDLISINKPDSLLSYSVEIIVYPALQILRESWPPWSENRNPYFIGLKDFMDL